MANPDSPGGTAIVTGGRRIVLHPDPRLRLVSRPLPATGRETRELADEMLATMRRAGGIGLAAIQVGEPVRLVVVEVPGFPTLVMANPAVLRSSRATYTRAEGCLSIPGFRLEVTRPARVTVGYVDPAGRPATVKADGLLATCLQHEVDHLDGKLYTDRVA